MQIIVDNNYQGLRLDKALAEYLSGTKENITRSHITDSIKNSLVLINSKVITKAGTLLKLGDKIDFQIVQRGSTLEPDSDVSFQILYEDEDILVINKPAGLVIHPGAGVKEKTLVHGILSHLGNEKFENNKRPGIVHRLDKGTSGIMIVSKNEQSLNKLQKQFLPPRTIHRTYLAYVSGRLKKLKGVTLNSLEGQADLSGTAKLSGTIDAPIIRHLKKRTIFMVSPNFKEGRSAVTHFKFLNSDHNKSLVELSLETGRTHQIRVHLSYLGLPIIGDTVYGGSNLATRPLLHAYKLRFIHPTSNVEMEFEALVPEDFKIFFL